MRPTYEYDNALNDPEVARKMREVTGEPEPEPHPMVGFGQKILAPLYRGPSTVGRYDPRATGYEIPQQQAPADLFGALSFLPAWAQAAGDFAGDKLRGAMDLSIGDAQPVKGAFEGLGWLGENVSDPIVGAGTAVLADTAENIGNTIAGRGFGGTYSQTDAARRMGAGEYRREVGEGFRRVREDPDAPLGSRVAGALAGGLQLGADATMPLVPGAALVSSPVRAAARGARGAAGDLIASAKSAVRPLPGSGPAAVRGAADLLGTTPEEAARILADPEAARVFAASNAGEVALGSEQIAARIGAVTPAQRAASDDFARQVAMREAQLTGIQRTAPLSAEIEKAMASQQRRMSRLAGKAAEGRMTADEADELASFLERQGAPAEVIRPLREVADAGLTEKARVADERGAAQAAARATNEGNVVDFRAAARDASSAVYREQRTAAALERAEDALRVRENRLMTIEQEEGARLAKKAEAQKRVRESMTTDALAAEVRIPKAVESHLAAMERRLASAMPDAAGTGSPARYAQAIRAEAKRIRADVQRLPKRGLIGSREADFLPPDAQEGGRGSSASFRQSEAQKSRPGELVYGRNTYRPTSDRTSLEAQAAELDTLAARISDELGQMRTARDYISAEKAKLRATSDEERFLLRNSPTYRDFSGVSEIDEAAVQAAQKAIDDASSRLAGIISEAHERGIRPSQAVKVDALLRSIREDMEALRYSVARSLAGDSTTPTVARQDLIDLEDDLTAARAKLDEAESVTTRTRIADQHLSAEMGYAAPRDEALLAEFGVNTGKWFSPTTRKVLADMIRQNPAEFRARRARITNDELLNDHAKRVAAKVGMEPDALKAVLPKRGELSGLLVVADIALDDSALKLQRAGRELRDGKISQSQFDEVYARHVDLQSDVSEGGSEVARAEASRRIQKGTDLVDVFAANKNVETAEKAMRDAEKALNRDAEVAAAAEAAEAARPDLSTSKRVLAAREALAKSRARVEEAVSAHRLAVEAAAETSERAHAAFLKKAVKSGFDKSQIEVLARLDPDNIFEIHNFFVNAHKMSRGEKLVGWMMGNVYSGLPSQMLNFVNGGVRALYTNALERPIAAYGTQKIVGRLSGRTDAMVPAEVKQAWIGLATAPPDAWRLLRRTMLQGEDPETMLKLGLVSLTEDSAEKFGTSSRPLAMGKKGLLIEPALRGLRAADGFWSVFNALASQRSLYARDAYRAGLKTDAQVSEYVARRMRTPDEKVRAEAGVEALRNNYNDPAAPGTLTANMLRYVNTRIPVPGLGPTPALRLLFPVVRFAANSIRFVSDASPYGAIRATRMSLAARKLNPENADVATREAARVASRSLIGTAFMVMANHLYDQGGITNDGFHAGRDENGKDVYVSYDVAGPIAAPFRLVSNVRTALDEHRVTDKEVADQIGRAIGVIGGVLTDHASFQGTAEIVDAVEGVQRYGWSSRDAQYKIAQVAGRGIPVGAGLNSLVPVFDPIQREADTIEERIGARLPFASQNLPARLDEFGHVVERRRSGLDAISPLQPTRIGPTDPVRAELDRDGVALGFVSEVIGGVKLNDTESRQYLEMAGNDAYAALTILFSSPEYRAAADKRERDRLRDRAINVVRGRARAVVADNALANAKTDEEITRAATMVRSQIDGSLRDHMTFIERLDDFGKLTPAVARALDTTRGFHRTEDGVTSRNPTVAEMRRDAALVHEFLQTPPYRIGSPAEWAELKRATAAAKQYAESTNKPAGLPTWQWYAQVDPEAAGLIRKYSYAHIRSPRREEMLKANPHIAKYLTVTIPIQVVQTSAR